MEPIQSQAIAAADGNKLQCQYVGKGSNGSRIMLNI